MRTALLNYLFAKKHDGDFILRIEDTDESRTVPGAEEYIIKSLKWAGIIPTEGVGFGNGNNPPEYSYKQSVRNNTFNMYRPFAEKLVAEGNAYLAFDTVEEVERMAEAVKASGAKTPFSYGVFTRMKMTNSLTLSKEEVDKRLERGDPYVIRMKMPHNVDIKFHDKIRGDMNVKSHNCDDKVLFKSTGMPTYHLANVVDDHEMKITHVVRGEEWLTSATLHIWLWKCLGWEDVIPEYVHLPLILGPDGKKLSKRDGDKYGFPVYPLDATDPETGLTSKGYKESGYLPVAFNNMIALLGWSPGSNLEIMTMDEMIEHFSFEKVGKSGAKFDPKKAVWINGKHINMTDDGILAKMVMDRFVELRNKMDGWNFKAYSSDENYPDNPFFTKFFYDVNELEEFSNIMESTSVGLYEKKGQRYFSEHVKTGKKTQQYLEKVCGLMKEKISSINDFWELGKYFFIAPDGETVQHEAPMKILLLSNIIGKMSLIESIDHDIARSIFDESVKLAGIEAKEAGKILRMAITGLTVGPPIFDVISLLGKDEVIKRLVKSVSSAKLLDFDLKKS